MQVQAVSETGLRLFFFFLKKKGFRLFNMHHINSHLIIKGHYLIKASGEFFAHIQEVHGYLSSP
jgi:hypothetical protein